MRLKTMGSAIAEAKRFIIAGEAAIKRLKLDRPDLRDYYDFTPTIESGAARRASMDLTRKLADLRQGR